MNDKQWMTREATANPNNLFTVKYVANSGTTLTVKDIKGEDLTWFADNSQKVIYLEYQGLSIVFKK